MKSVVAGTTTVNKMSNRVTNAANELRCLNLFSMNLCSGEKIIANVAAHRRGSKKGLSKKINASVAATKSVKKKICLIKMEIFILWH